MGFVKILEPQIEIIHKSKKNHILLYRCRHSYKIHIDMENRSTKKSTNYDTICKSILVNPNLLGRT